MILFEAYIQSPAFVLWTLEIQSGTMSNLPVYYVPQTRQSSDAAATPASPMQTDICIYGGTSGGIMAAVQAKRLGHSVVVLAFGTHLGGLTSGGLGATDIGNKQAIGGLAREFYQELGKHYGEEIAWTFEPSAASKVFDQYLRKYDIPVFYNQHLESTQMDGQQIRSIRMEDGSEYQAKVFIDATYEGDLMAQAGVSYTIGREANDTYQEIYNGIQAAGPFHNFRRFVDPYRTAGDPSSGLLPGVSDDPVGINGQADKSIQAYNFRLCLSWDDNNRKPFNKPLNYDPERYTLLARYLQTGIWDSLNLSREMPNRKTDTNNYGGFSTDHIGANHEWPEASYARRQEIFQDHVDYTQGIFWFLTQDERVPQHVREDMKRFSLTQDEFTSTGGWSPELYVREARRMVSDYVMTEHHCVGRDRAEDPVALAAYTMDSHNCRRIVVGGRAFNEGDVQIGGFTPYAISFKSIVPKANECQNLIVPWCLSASHIAFGSIRMEPVFMVLGQSAATIASQSIQENAPVQKISYPTLRKKLLEDQQVLEWNPTDS